MADIVNYKAGRGIGNITGKFWWLMAEVKKIYLAANLDYAMTLQFMDRLEKNGKISSDERMRLKDEIETKEGKPSVIDSSDRVQRELRRMKVVNNRDNVFDDKPVDTHNGNK